VNCAIVSALYPERKKQGCCKEENEKGRLGMACLKTEHLTPILLCELVVGGKADQSRMSARFLA